jgi:anti-sigma factor RsiW
MAEMLHARYDSVAQEPVPARRLARCPRQERLWPISEQAVVRLVSAHFAGAASATRSWMRRAP